MPIYSGAHLSAMWKPQGTVLAGVAPDATNNVLEPTVLYDINPQIVGGTYCFKMWYTQGWGTWADIHINYAESTDGLSWTKYASNPLTSNYARSTVLKSGSTYYMYASYEDGRIDRLTSADGLSWTVTHTGVVAVGAGGTWDDAYLANPFVWIEGGTWNMLYEARRVSTVWRIGLATSADGITWSKSGSNPVITETGAVGGPCVHKAADGTYWLWLHRAPSNSLPTSIYRYWSTNLTTWTRKPDHKAVVNRLGVDEGEGTEVGQTADPSVLEVNGRAYMYYSATAHGGDPSGHLHICARLSDLSLDELVRTEEGP